MTINRFSSSIFISFVVAMLTACSGGGGGGGSDPGNTNNSDSGSGTTITVPGAPVIGSATAGNAQATVTFTAPASNGGAAITGYTVTSSSGGFTATGPASPLTVTGLTNGSAYTFTVTATNSAGTGPASAASNSVTPNSSGSGSGTTISVPGAPVISSVIVGDAQATVTFTTPVTNGGATITGYTVTSSPGGFTASGSASPLIVTGLTNGVAYTFTVTATNSAGTGAASASSSGFTPIGVTVVNPPVVSISATSPKLLTFSWTGIAGATHYKLLKNPDGVSGYTQVGVNLPGTATTSTDYIGVHLHDWINASYIVQACNAGGCDSSSAVFTTAAMIASMGYLTAVTNAGADAFAWSVSLSGDGTTLAVGAPQHSPLPTDGSPPEGAVYVFTRSGNSWSQQAYITPRWDFDYFGWSVSLSADGNTLAVGATGRDGSTPEGFGPDIGVVYVYSRSGSTWSTSASVAVIRASIPGWSDEFGYSVSLSADGNTLAVGAHGEESTTTGINSTPDEDARYAGAVYVLSRNGSSWSQEAYIKASNTGAGDRFGHSVSLSADGATLAVGATEEDSSTTGINSTSDEGASLAGAVYVFTRSGTTWSQQAYIKASNTGAGDRFGDSVSLSGDGATLAVGATEEDSSTTGINSTANESASNAGATYVFSRSGSSWSQQAYIKASNTVSGREFGTSVSLAADGITLAVGAVNAAYVFRRSGSSWSQAFARASSGSFGNSMSLSADGTTLAVGASSYQGSPPSYSAPNGVSGVVYLY